MIKVTEQVGECTKTIEFSIVEELIKYEKEMKGFQGVVENTPIKDNMVLVTDIKELEKGDTIQFSKVSEKVVCSLYTDYILDDVNTNNKYLMICLEGNTTHYVEFNKDNEIYKVNK